MRFCSAARSFVSGSFHRRHHLRRQRLHQPRHSLILYSAATRTDTHVTGLFYTRNSHFLGAMHLYALRVLATATWLAGWVAVCHSRYCIKTTKPILKLFRPSGSPITVAFGIPCGGTKLQGEPFIGGYMYTPGVGKLAISTEMADISETVRDRMMVTMER